MEKIDLISLHQYLRYGLNIGDIKDSLSKISDNIISGCDLKELLIKRSILIEKYEQIISTIETRLNSIMKGEVKLSKIDDELSLLSLGAGLTLNESAMKDLDILSYRIVDYTYVCGEEKKEGRELYGTYASRSPQMLSKQKGELWILNYLYNTLKLAIDKKLKEETLTTKELEDYTKHYLDTDISPYPHGVKKTSAKVSLLESRVKTQQKELEEAGRQYTEQTKLETLYSTPITLESRRLGVELEHQVEYSGTKSLEIMTEDEKLQWIKENLYDTSDSDILKKVSAGTHPEDGVVIKNGTLTRDVSNMVYQDITGKKYLACEYSSPVASGYEALGKNIDDLCKAINSHNGLVREDAGTHIHVSIEDLKVLPSDSQIVAKQKLDAIKRVIINYILLREQLEQVMPECRKNANSVYSAQSHESFLKDNKELMVGLIANASSYEEIRKIITVGGKYLSLMPYENTVEIRTLQATTNPEVIKLWAQLMSTMVQNSIEGKAIDKCLDYKILEQLKVLTKNGTEIQGIKPDDPQNICYPTNTWIPSGLKNIPSTVISYPIDTTQLQKNCMDYSQELAINMSKIPGYDTMMPIHIRSSVIAQGIAREAGEGKLDTLSSTPVEFKKDTREENNTMLNATLSERLQTETTHLQTLIQHREQKSLGELDKM